MILVRDDGTQICPESGDREYLLHDEATDVSVAVYQTAIGPDEQLVWSKVAFGWPSSGASLDAAFAMSVMIPMALRVAHLWEAQAWTRHPHMDKVDGQ